LKEVLDHYEQNGGCLNGIATNIASSNYSMTHELHTSRQASRIEWPTSTNRIPCMGHVIQLALFALISSLGVNGSSKSWEAHEHDQQFGENESTDIGKSQILQKEGNGRINKLSAMSTGFAKIIEKVHTSTCFECA
jgi:hypothetical protein